MLFVTYQTIRLFADDTSIGHIAHDETTLKNMINIDLKYIQEWSKRWLVKFNPSKTDIMVFSANNQQNDLTFDFNSTLIQTVLSFPTQFHNK
jgi:hypothetical protein